MCLSQATSSVLNKLFCDCLMLQFMHCVASIESRRDFDVSCKAVGKFEANQTF